MSIISEFIQSGLLELYALGSTSPEEAVEVEQMVSAHPEVRRELDLIYDSMEAYAIAHAVTPKATIKPLIMATINYLERVKQGEQILTPPELKPNSQISDFAAWLQRPDMVLPPESAGIYAKIICATPEATTAIVWLTGIADNEVHDHEYERFLIVEGTCTITAAEEAHKLHPGDYYAVPLHTRHMVQVTSNIPCKVILQRIAA